MEKMKHGCIEAGIDQGVITIMLNRPEARNAINEALAEDVMEAIGRYAYRKDAKVLVIQGQGKSFCAGYDVTQNREALTPREQWISTGMLGKMFDAIGQAPVIRVAAIQGYAMGAGLELALACELRYASNDAIFGIPELDYGIPYSFGATNNIVRYIGVTRAADMILNCRRVSAEEAVEWGLITGNCASQNDLIEKARVTAGTLAKRPSVLLLNVQDDLERAAKALTPDGFRNVSAFLYTRSDDESAGVGKAYARKILHR